MNKIICFIIAILMFYSCNNKNKHTPEPTGTAIVSPDIVNVTEVFIPDEEDKSLPLARKMNSITFAKISPQSWFYYRDTSIYKGMYCEAKSWYDIFSNLRKGGNDSLLIIFHSNSMLYEEFEIFKKELKLKKIEDYLNTSFTDAEESLSYPIKFLNHQAILMKPSTNSNIFLIEIGENHSVWCKIKIAGSSFKSQKIAISNENEIEAVISVLAKKFGNNQPQYMLKLNLKSDISDFDKVIGALNKNGIYKYSPVKS